MTTSRGRCRTSAGLARVGLLLALWLPNVAGWWSAAPTAVCAWSSVGVHRRQPPRTRSFLVATPPLVGAGKNGGRNWNAAGLRRDCRLWTQQSSSFRPTPLPHNPPSASNATTVASGTATALETANGSPGGANGANQLATFPRTPDVPDASMGDHSVSPAAPVAVLRRTLLHSPDEVATTTLGDIMGMGMITGAPPFPSSESLQERYGISHPLDRVALTANGNLQRLVGSYYDAPVSVVLDSQVRVDDDISATTSASDRSHSSRSAEVVGGSGVDSTEDVHVWERAVHLTVFGRTFCKATSVIRVRDSTCQHLVESGKVGLGQLFRYLDLLPEFVLLGAGPLPTPSHGAVTATSGDREGSNGGGGNFWREYRLECRELSCWIREEFCPGLWALEPPAAPP